MPVLRVLAPMKPYYEGHGATLYLGDCLEVLDGLERDSVDLIVTDPPYGVSWQSGRRHIAFSLIRGDESVDVGLAGIAAAVRLLRPRRHVYAFGKWNIGRLPLGGVCDLVWDKAIIGPGNLAIPWGPSHEPIMFGVHTPSAANRSAGDGNAAARLRRGSVLSYARRNSRAVRSHPTEKPVDLLRELIESSSRVGELVLDPFVGIGSTCVAAAVEGRGSIGIEIEERYLEVAAKRLEAVRVEYV